jgi:hypothetical protein
MLARNLLIAEDERGGMFSHRDKMVPENGKIRGSFVWKSIVFGEGNFLVLLQICVIESD